MAAGRGFRLWVAGSALVGLILRLTWGLRVDRPPQGLYDPARYVGYARAIAGGRGMIEPLSGFPTAYYPPGYPWFLGIITWLGRPLTDSVVTIAVVVQALLGAATVVLAALVARRLAGPRAGVVAAAAMAVYPNLIFHSGAVLGETLYNFLFLAFCAIALGRAWPRSLTRARIGGAAVVLGLAVMVRPISLAVLPAVGLAWWLADRDLRRTAGRMAILLAGVVLVVAPWTTRNAVRMHELVPISTNTGDNLCIGHGPEATGAFRAAEDCVTKYNFLDGPADEVAADKAKTRTAIDAIGSDPGREPWLAWRRFWFMWVRDGDHDGLLAVQSYRADRFISPTTEARLAYGADLAYWLVCIAGVAGAVSVGLRRRPEGLFILGCALMTALVPLAFFGDSRFKVPVIPLLIVLGACLVPSRPEATDR